MSDSMRDFIAMLAYTPTSRGDTIVCLAGEEGEARATTAAHLFKMGYGQGILVTGGRCEPPIHAPARMMTPLIAGHGIAGDRIITDDGPQHTREQAVSVVEKAVEKEWKRLVLVASAYHMPRSYLTFVKALTEAGQQDRIYVVPAAVLGADRFVERLEAELEKCVLYAKHVADPKEGLTYLRAWAGK